MAYITINDLDGIPSEIFLNVGKAGSDVFAMAEAGPRLLLVPALRRPRQ